LKTKHFVSLKNLQVDLENNQNSMELLNTAKRSNNIGGPILAVGILSLSSSIIWWIVQTKGQVLPSLNIYRATLFVAGVVSVTVGGLFFRRGKSFTREAAVMYNL
jgi:hypothetical protein